MKYTNHLSIFLLAALALSFTYKPKQEANEWVYEREKKGIKVFTKKSKWGRLRDSKAVMLLNSTPDEIAQTLLDYENFARWVPRCSASRIVARLSENEFIAYTAYKSPWPVADRDCVVRVKVSRDSKGGITIQQTSEPKYLKEKEGVVRIQQMVGIWKLTPTANGTEVLNEYSVNPGGNIPDWLINTQCVEAPIETFEKLQEVTTVKK